MPTKKAEAKKPKKTKAQLIRELNQMLLLKDVNWQLLPKKDIAKLYNAFLRLRDDVEEVFKLCEEAPFTRNENRNKKLNYCI